MLRNRQVRLDRGPRWWERRWSRMYSMHKLQTPQDSVTKWSSCHLFTWSCLCRYTPGVCVSQSLPMKIPIRLDAKVLGDRASAYEFGAGAVQSIRTYVHSTLADGSSPRAGHQRPYSCFEDMEASPGSGWQWLTILQLTMAQHLCSCSTLSHILDFRTSVGEDGTGRSFKKLSCRQMGDE